MNKLLKNVLTLVAVVTVIFFGSKAIQSYLGEQAVKDLSFTVHTLEAAKSIAQEQGKLVLADYSAVWCPSCRKLDTQVFAHAQISELVKNNFIFARLDHDTAAGAAFAKTHNLVGFPRVLVLDANGKRLTEMPLTFNPFEYELNLKKVSQRFGQ